VSDRRQQPRPPVRPPVTGYSRSPWHKYRLGKCDRRPRAPHPHQPGNYPDLKSQNIFGFSFFLSFYSGPR
jgi:hypothetical protein